MNSKIAKRNLEKLLNLKKQLEAADVLFMEMSKLVVSSMLKNNQAENIKGQVFTFDRRRQKIINEVVIALETICPEMRLQFRSTASDHDFISYMIQSNARTEELEKIISSIMKQNEEFQTDKSHQNRNGRSLMGIHDFSEEFNRKFEKEQLLTKCPNILICGKTGVGKTSLIQAVTHRGIVSDSTIGNGKAATVGFQLYETEIANFIDSEGMNPGVQSVEKYADFVLNEMLERLDSDEKSRLIHNIWYCIDGSGAQVQEADAKLIKSFGDKVILVVTKSELMRKEQIESMMKMLLALIGRERIVFVSAESKTGLCQLIARAETVSTRSMAGAEAELEAFRDHWNDYYDKMKASWMQCVSSDADNYVNWAAGRAAAIALVPLPLADVGPLIANEVYMIYKLAGIYGIAVDNTVVTMLLGCAGGSLIGKIGASFLPFLKIPIAAAVTYGVGKTAKAYFESEMTLSPSELKAEFMAGEREAKKREWKPINAE